MMKPSQRQERRRHPRFPLGLPLDHRTLGSSDPYGGIAIDGSEAGLLIYSLQDMSVGSPLIIAVLFADEFELTHFDVATRIVRKVRSANGQGGYGYGLRFVQISEENFRRLRRLLHRSQVVHPDNAFPVAREYRFISADQTRQPEKKRISFPALFKKLSI
jgi:PilZ domain